MLKEILVDGYKSINRESVELKPFTLFSGVNSAGKSSVIQAINYVLDLQSKQSEIQANWGNPQIGKFVDVRNNIKGGKEIIFQIQEEDQQGDKYTAKVVYSGGENGDPAQLVITKGDEHKNYTNEDKHKYKYKYKSYINEYRKIYLSTERVGVQNTYELSTHNPLIIGDRGKYAFSYLAYFGQEALKESAFLYNPEEVGMSLNNQVNYWMDYLLGFQIRVKPIPEVDQVIAMYSNSKNNRYYRAANVGTGVTYIAMLIIAALSCKKGDTLIIENPEIHLHPRAQSRLMEFAAFLCERGLQIIMETHSDHIYNGMRKCIKRNTLDRENIAAYYFELDETMQTKIHHISFNDQGAEENHPYGMFDQFDDDLDELIGM